MKTSLSGAIRHQDNLVDTCSHLLDSLNVKYTRSHLKRLRDDHLDPLSLLAIKDILAEYGVESGALRKGRHSYHDFELPFVCSVQEESWPAASFAVVTDVVGETIEYLDPGTKKLTKISLGQFESIDKGVVMLFDGDGRSDEPDFGRNYSKERNERILGKLPLYIALAGILGCIWHILANYNPAYSWASISYLFTACAGSFISYLLVWHEVDRYNRLLKQVCGNGKKKVNCNAVLSSSHSSFFGISWSVWGGSFFFTLLLIQLLFSNNLSYLLVSACFSALAFPYVFYSVYVQWRVIRQWCTLCLSIQGLLLTNVLIAWGIFNQSGKNFGQFVFHTQPFIVAVALGLAVFFALFSLIPILKVARDGKGYERNFKLLKSDKGVFESMLRKGEAVTQPVDGLGIILGNPEARNEIVKVCNPYCGPCSEMHPKLERIVRSNSDVRLRIIFTASLEPDDHKRKPVFHFLALEHHYGREFVHNALDAWYGASDLNYEDFSAKFPVDGDLSCYGDKVAKMRRWCELMKIRSTPTLFINGYELPAAYDIDDLKHIF